MILPSLQEVFSLDQHGVFFNVKESYRFQIISKYLNGDIQKPEAAQLLQLSERQVSRISIKISHKTIWYWVKQAGLVPTNRKRRKIKRIHRERLPQEGLLLQMDGSHHKWNGKDEWCLITAIDDATSNIPHAEFFKGETTIACMKVLKKIIETKGVPKAIYTDKAGWTGGMKRTDFSQFQRACEKLGIQIVYANSPEAKGRIERAFRTFQDRLIPEMRSKKIKTMKNANQYVQDQFLKNYWNRENVVKPLNKETAYSPLDPYKNLDQILVIESRRKIGSDHTVSWDGKRYKIDSGRYSFAGYKAVFREGLDGSLKVYVMENEVKLGQIMEPIRIEPSAESIAKEIIHDPELFLYMATTITKLRNRFIRHLVSGKPLNLNQLDKEVA
jgi:transposase-like protein